MSGQTRQPGCGLPKENTVSIVGDMLVVEFCFGDIGDRAVALSAIEEVKFTERPHVKSQGKERQESFIAQGDNWIANPDMEGSIDVIIKPDGAKYEDAPKQRSFYFTGTRQVWRYIIDAMAGDRNHRYLNDAARRTHDQFGNYNPDTVPQAN